MRPTPAWMRYFAAATIALCVAACAHDEDLVLPTPEGHALAIGLNEVDPEHYGGWSGALTGCEPDVEDMKGIAVAAGFETTTLITQAATRHAVLEQLSQYAQKLKADDVLVVSYSGHGGNVLDHNGDETDHLDETWVLYDGQLIDDELAQAWSKFREGVRIFFLSDSCHSGTVLRMPPQDTETPEPRMLVLADKWKETRRLEIKNEAALLEDPRMLEVASTQSAVGILLERQRARLRNPDAPPPPQDEEPGIFTIRAMPPEVAVNTYEMHRDFYKEKGEAAPKESDVVIKASVISISGCQDDQFSADLGFNGLFTFKLKEVWNAGAFQGGHPDFHEQIRDAVVDVNPDQSPAFNTAGKPDLGFEAERPYTIPE